MAHVLMWIESPLQSWGCESKFDRRDTLNFPTKSGIMGLVCCALGYSGEQREFLAEFANLDMTVLSFRKDNQQVKLRDFHMVGSGYNNKDPWQSLMIPKTSDGDKAVGGGAKLTYRYYLQDARFAVILEVPDDKADLVSSSLQSPVWDLYFGRKTCVPSDFIYRGVYDSIADAKERAMYIAMDKGLIHDFSVIDGRSSNSDFVNYMSTEVMVLNDVPVSFGVKKEYATRFVTVLTNYPVANLQQELQAIDFI
jgi:CRISPR system Cascade subunit CasD